MGSEQLYVDVEARLTDLEKGMKRAQAIANKAYAGMKRDSHDAAQAMERDMAGSINRVGSMMKNLGKGFLGGLVAGGVGELINQVGQVAKGIAAIGDEAKRAGVSAKAFQEWKYVAEQNRIPVDAMVDALKELNLRADEFVVTGKGPAAEAFGRLGISAEQLREKLKQPDKLLLEIIGKVQTLDKAAQIRVFDEIFGGQGGERMVELIAQGEQGIRNTIAAAHDLNIVMDDKLIAKAAELDRKFNAITVTVGTALKTAIVEAAGALQSFIDEFRGFESRATSSLEDRLQMLMTRRGQLEKQKGTLEDSALALIGKDAETELKAIDTELATIAAELRKRALPRLRQELLSQQPPRGEAAKTGRLGFADRVVAAENSTGNPAARNPRSSAMGDGQFLESTWLALFRKHFPDEAARMGEKAILELRGDSERSRQMIDIYAAENARILQAAGVSVDEAAKQLAHFLGPQGAIAVLKASAGTPIEQVLGPSVIAANPEVLGGGKTAGDVVAYAERRAGAKRTETAAVKENTAAVGQNRDAWAGLRDVGDPWEGMRAKTVEATAAVDQQKEAYKELGEVGMTAVRGIANALADGKIESDEWLDILTDVAQQLLNMSSFNFGGGGMGGGSGGGIGSILSSLLGSFLGGFSQGGYTGSGGRQDPAGLVHRGEYVFSKRAVDRIGAGNLEAMHRQLKGYASGGMVGVPAPAMPVAPAMPRRGGGGGQAGGPMQIGVEVRFNEKAGGFVAFLDKRSQAQIDRYNKTMAPSTAIRAVQQYQVRGS